MLRRLLPACLLLALSACSSHPDAAQPVSKEELAPAPTTSVAAPAAVETAAQVQQHLSDYATVKLTADLSAFDAKQKQMIALLVEAADSMNALYWKQSWGDKEALLAKIGDVRPGRGQPGIEALGHGRILPCRAEARVSAGPARRATMTHTGAPGPGRPASARGIAARPGRTGTERPRLHKAAAAGLVSASPGRETCAGGAHHTFLMHCTTCPEGAMSGA